MNKTIEVQDLGLRDYKDVWDFQETLFKATIDVNMILEIILKPN